MSKPQRVLLTIGFESFLLPDDTGVQTVMKCLSRALPVRDWLHRNELHISHAGDPPEIGMKYVPAKVKIIQGGDSSLYDDDAPPARPALREINGMLPLPERSEKTLL